MVERICDFTQHGLGFGFDLVTGEVEVDAVDLGLSSLLQLLLNLLATAARTSWRAGGARILGDRRWLLGGRNLHHLQHVTSRQLPGQSQRIVEVIKEIKIGQAVVSGALRVHRRERNPLVVQQHRKRSQPIADALQCAFRFAHVGQVFGFFWSARGAASRHLPQCTEPRSRHPLQSSNPETELRFSLSLELGQHFTRNADRSRPGDDFGFIRAEPLHIVVRGLQILGADRTLSGNRLAGFRGFIAR